MARRMNSSTSSTLSVFLVHWSDPEQMAGKVELILPDEMTHSLMDPFVHITDPICRFMDKALKQERPLFSTAITIPNRYFQSN